MRRLAGSLQIKTSLTLSSGREELNDNQLAEQEDRDAADSPVQALSGGEFRRPCLRGE
jgi:hypothetical protein